MFDTFLAGQLLRFGYRIRSPASNERRFSSAVAAIEEMVAAAFRLRLHVPQVRRSIEVNSRS